MSFNEMVERAERVALTTSHPAARAVIDAWCDMSHRARLANESAYQRFYCKLYATGACRCGQHEYSNEE